jgi:hypothetical protein
MERDKHIEKGQSEVAGQVNGCVSHFVNTTENISDLQNSESLG